MRGYSFNTGCSKCNSRYINRDFFEERFLLEKMDDADEDFYENDFWFVEDEFGRCVGCYRGDSGLYDGPFRLTSTLVNSVHSRKAFGRLLRRLPRGRYRLFGAFYEDGYIDVFNNSGVVL